ncbi:hypothetical protein [Spirosoma oryzicola]|uniref:hypothetical protein n=1 Tax=Spirosoma oryzicola TaxID=2898794 RepID=UPI001E41B038|nr:hypothetical protein [Spirosoma oryzicola]UHG92527.1 hypothetical protein LQ777_06370 [Spirosoma oryzicola]
MTGIEFDESEFLLQLNVRVYYSEKRKSHVKVEYTLKPNDLSAIPQNILTDLGKLTFQSTSSPERRKEVIQEILTKGYHITSAPSITTRESIKKS